MKSKLFILLLTAIGLSNVAVAQQAADFTITDMHGNTHNLYTYLNDDKIVILDFWATWCGPCLGSVPGLEDIWENHGPEGDQTYIVISLEFDANTNNELATIAQHGMTNIVAYADPNGYRAIANSFNYAGSIPYFVVICPDKTWTDRTGGIGSTASLLTNIGNNCGVSSSIVNDGKLKSIESPGEYICPGEVLNPMVTIQNIGSSSLTSLNIETFLDNASEGVFNWTGSLVKFGTAQVPLSTLSNVSYANHNLRVEVSDPNNTQDENALNNEKDIDIIPAPEAGDTVVLTITPDDYGSEISWNLKNGMGQVIRSVPANTYPDNDNTPVTETFILNPDGCYTFEMVDSYGDGIFAPGGYKLESRGNVLIQGGAYSNNEISKFHNKGQTSTSVEDIISVGSVEVLPNPAKDQVVINFSLSQSGRAEISLWDLSGKNIASHQLGHLEEGMHNHSLDISSLASGIYLLELSSKGERIVKQLVKVD